MAFSKAMPKAFYVTLLMAVMTMMNVKNPHVFIDRVSIAQLR